MLTITTKPNVTLCFPEIPEGAKEFEVSTNNRLVCWIDIGFTEIDLPPGEWEFIATTETATEGQAKELVETIAHPLGLMYKDYTDDYSCFTTAIESIRSAIVAAGGIEKQHYVILKNKL